MSFVSLDLTYLPFYLSGDLLHFYQWRKKRSRKTKNRRRVDEGTTATRSITLFQDRRMLADKQNDKKCTHTVSFLYLHEIYKCICGRTGLVFLFIRLHGAKQQPMSAAPAPGQIRRKKKSCRGSSSHFFSLAGRSKTVTSISIKSTYCCLPFRLVGSFNLFCPKEWK